MPARVTGASVSKSDMEITIAGDPEGVVVPDAAQAASWFLKQGFHAFPIWGVKNGRCMCPKGAECPSPGKHPGPAAKRGFKDAISDPAKLTKLLGNPGTPNYGLVAPPGVIILDVDGPDIARLAGLEAQLGPLPDSFRVKTPNGLHIYLRIPSGESLPTGKLWGGFVVRRGGAPAEADGYVVGPGSRGLGGVYGRLLPESGVRAPFIAEIPASWLDAAREKEAGTPKPAIQVLSITLSDDPATELYEIPTGDITEGHRYDEIRNFQASYYNRVGGDREVVYAAAVTKLLPKMGGAPFESEFRARFDRAWRGIEKRLGEPHAPGERAAAAKQPTTEGPLGIKSFSAYNPMMVGWLWQNWLPRGVVTLLDGNPGEGKSTVVMDLIARLTTGRDWPDGQQGGKIERALYITREDDPETTLVPRLIAAGGDLTKASFLENEMILPNDAQKLWDAIEAAGPFGLIVIDPLFSHIGANVKTISDNDVRMNVMNPLSVIAKAANAAVLVLRHYNKAVGEAALLRGAGSLGGLVGAARQVLGVTTYPDESEDDIRAFGVVKSNYAKTGRTWKYRVEGVMLQFPGWTQEVTRAEWLGQSTLSIHDIVTEPDHYKAMNAAEELEKLLKGQTGVAARKVFADMKARGFGEAAVNGAKRRLGIKPRKNGMTGGWEWWLPTAGFINLDVSSTTRARAGGALLPPSSPSSPSSAKPEIERKPNEDVEDGDKGAVGRTGHLRNALDLSKLMESDPMAAMKRIWEEDLGPDT